MSRTGYPFLQRNRKLERDKRDEEIEFLRRQLAVIGNIGNTGNGRAFNTGYGEDGRLQPNMPTHMLRTNAGSRTIHEGEDVNIGPNGQFSVAPAEQSGGMQSAIAGFRGGTMPSSQNYIDITKQSVSDAIIPASQFGGQRGLRMAERTGRVPGFQEGTDPQGLESFLKNLWEERNQQSAPAINTTGYYEASPTAVKSPVAKDLPTPVINTASYYDAPPAPPQQTVMASPSSSVPSANDYYSQVGDIMKGQTNKYGITNYSDLSQIKKAFDSYRASGTPLPNDLLQYYYAAGGTAENLRDFQMYDPTTGTWGTSREVVEPAATPYYGITGARTPETATSQIAPSLSQPISGPQPTATPPEKADTTDYGRYVNRGLQRLERYAEGQDPFAAKIREEELGRFKGEESAARGALAQELSQAGISGREALTAQARQGRQIGAEQAEVLSQLRKGEADRAFQAATQIPGEARASQHLDFLKQQWGDQEGTRMANDALVMDEATWLSKHPNAKPEDYARARDVADRSFELQRDYFGLSERQFNEGVRQFNVGADQWKASQLLSTGDFEGYSEFFESKFGYKPNTTRLIQEWETQNTLNNLTIQSAEVGLESARTVLSEMRRDEAGENLFNSIDKALLADPDLVRDGKWKTNAEIMADMKEYWNTSGMYNIYGEFDINNPQHSKWAENQVQAYSINEIDAGFNTIRGSEWFNKFPPDEQNEYNNIIFPAMMKLAITQGYDISFDEETGEVTVKPIGTAGEGEPLPGEEPITSAYTISDGFLNIDGTQIRDTAQITSALRGANDRDSANYETYQALVQNAPALNVSIADQNTNTLSNIPPAGSIINVNGRLMQVKQTMKRTGANAWDIFWGNIGYDITNADGTTSHQDIGRDGRERDTFVLIDVATGKEKEFSGASNMDDSVNNISGWVNSLESSEV